jgi:hypothetical protein
MSFCEHFQGQSFDRAQVLRKLRETRRDVRTQRGGRPAEQAIALAIKVVRAMEIPHLEPEEDPVVH